MPRDKKQEDPPKKSKWEKKILPQDIQGLKYFRALRPFLEHLHSVGAERDRAHNRQLHMDQYCMLILLWLYTPLIDSMRGMQQASELKKVQKKLKISRASLGSLSESVNIFDPEPLKRIASELADQLPDPARPEKLKGLGDTAHLADDAICYDG